MTTPRQVLFPNRLPVQGLSILENAKAGLAKEPNLKLARKMAREGWGSEDLTVHFGIPRALAKQIVREANRK